MKVSFKYPEKKAILEVTNSTGILIESEELLDSNEAILKLQIKMIQKAAEYKNRGMEVIINPFTN